MSFSTPQKAGQSDRAHCFFLKVQGHQRQGLNDAVLVAAGLSTRSLLSHFTSKKTRQKQRANNFLTETQSLDSAKIWKDRVKACYFELVWNTYRLKYSRLRDRRIRSGVGRQHDSLAKPCFSTIQSRFTLQPHQHGHPCLRSPFAIEMEITDPTLTNTASWSKASSP